VAVAAAHGDPNGLLVVNIIITFFPISPLFGVYVNENGDVVVEAGLTEPVPLCVNVTLVALPPKVLPVTVKGVMLHVLPLILLRVTFGGFTHCPSPFIEIIKKRLTKSKTLDIFFT
jgi:hypothetical protein